MINILTDSTADIPKELCETYQIETIPVYIQLNGKVYKDGEDIHPNMLFEAVRNTGHYPTTSAPSPTDFMQFFNRETPSIYIGLSSQMSTTFHNAQLAQREAKNNTVDLIDSLSFSIGYGQVVIQAAKWRNEGMNFKELGIRIRERIKQSRGIFILDTLDYVYHGGRCSTIEHLFSSVLKIKPFLQILPDGTLGVLQKVRGSRKKAVNALLSYFINQFATEAIPEIFLAHYDCEEEVQFLAERIKSTGKPIQIYITKIGCALTIHSGPYPIGIAYHIA
jgi:DegV family protein with EDD domain